MSDPQDGRAAADAAADIVWREELAQAERRGAENARGRVRRIAPERRRLLREGDRTVELVEVEAVEEAFDER